MREMDLRKPAEGSAPQTPRPALRDYVQHKEGCRRGQVYSCCLQNEPHQHGWGAAQINTDRTTCTCGLAEALQADPLIRQRG
jgi:hypothetical protein